ncbi:hypothetical protein [Streptomyces sp. NPDC057557]|uniref:hypothetical protein n=1 Tax=Streptomyces sp. NPDC057557 TaxID=3346167 RepID=UPI0036758969
MGIMADGYVIVLGERGRRGKNQTLKPDAYGISALNDNDFIGSTALRKGWPVTSTRSQVAAACPSPRPVTPAMTLRRARI